MVEKKPPKKTLKKAAESPPKGRAASKSASLKKSPETSPKKLQHKSQPPKKPLKKAQQKPQQKLASESEKLAVDQSRQTCPPFDSASPQQFSNKRESDKREDQSPADAAENFDPFSFGRQMGGVLEKLQPLLTNYIQKIGQQDDLFSQGLSPAAFQPMMMDYWQNVIHKPQKLIDLNLEYAQNMALLWQETTRKFLGDHDSETPPPLQNSALKTPATHAAPRRAENRAENFDKRFRDPVWQESFVFDFIKQSYLLTSQWMQSAVRNTEGLSQRDRAKLDFFTRLFVDALSPTNFAATNPEVLRETLKSNGKNLLRGLENLATDLQRGDGELEISKTRYEAFEVGKNLATTPGSIIFENELMQLIHYAPATAQVYETPLLILPPWINKYYILDLRPDNSFVKWAVDQGHSVFMISWVNPDRSLGHETFENYMTKGLIAAMDAIEHHCGAPSVNVIGYCIGGTLLTASLAYLQAEEKKSRRKEARVASATFLTTLIDFHQAGDLSIFVDDQFMKLIDEKMDRVGYLEGSDLRQTFSLLRANDLIWSFVVNNYMMGKEPFPFDLLYWNDDSTNMPAAMHRFYLRNMYRDNKLARKGGIKLCGTPIDVTQIHVPSYFLSTKDDHIAPWVSTYEGMMLLGGKKRFVLAASGHVAGVINPPTAHKYHYWTNERLDDREHADEWLAKAEQHGGSWWDDWAKWVKKYAGKKVAARDPKKGKLKEIEPAPGRYVMKRA